MEVAVQVLSPPSASMIRPEDADPVGVLVGALASPANDEQTVDYCRCRYRSHGVHIDPDRRPSVAHCFARLRANPRRLGPRIFVTDAHGNEPLFVISGDYIRVSGFRLEARRAASPRATARRRAS